MKKVSLYLFALLIGLSSLTSCGGDEDDPTPGVKTTPMSVERNGVLGNKQGPTQGAYNLVSDARLSTAGTNMAPDSIQDMQNMTETSTANLWTANWTAKNATRFVKAPAGFDYANATVEKADSVYKAGSTLQIVSNPAANDVYIANLRGRNEYAVIKITSIVVTPGPTQVGGNNDDEVRFSYKKTK